MPAVHDPRDHRLRDSNLRGHARLIAIKQEVEQMHDASCFGSWLFLMFHDPASRCMNIYDESVLISIFVVNQEVSCELKV